ncbi:MAG TPA: glyoxalase [Lacisediminihabitans sp.]|uniref:glyoxalase n=1 Tax=Lacisediminihabitans sp. TaxID=2787631 RepID=UPI002ED95978
MLSINHLSLGTTDPDAAAAFYRGPLGLDDRIRAHADREPSSGFRGFTLGLDVPEPEHVDRLVAAAIDASAESLKPAKRQFWGGYSGVIRTPDGTVVKIATSDQKNPGTSLGEGSTAIERIVLLLGVGHVGRARDFYVAAGLAVAKAYGSRYVEFEPGNGAITLGLYKRPGLAKEFGVDPEGNGSHRLIIASNDASLTDPDGFTWQGSRHASS